MLAPAVEDLGLRAGVTSVPAFERVGRGSAAPAASGLAYASSFFSQGAHVDAAGTPVPSSGETGGLRFGRDAALGEGAGPAEGSSGRVLYPRAVMFATLNALPPLAFVTRGEK